MPKLSRAWVGLSVDYRATLRADQRCQRDRFDQPACVASQFAPVVLEMLSGKGLASQTRAQVERCVERPPCFPWRRIGRLGPVSGRGRDGKGTAGSRRRNRRVSLSRLHDEEAVSASDDCQRQGLRDRRPVAFGTENSAKNSAKVSHC